MVHNHAARQLQSPRRSRRAPLSATHVVRSARAGDATDIHALLDRYVADGAILPRTPEEVVMAIDSFVVIVDERGEIRGCASLIEYSPSVAEVAAVAVHPDAQGRGLGTLAVRSVEALARRRGVKTLFAVSRSRPFFEAMDYVGVPMHRYPEKQARHAVLRSRGVPVGDKPCFEKSLG